MQVLIADKFESSGIAGLKALGCGVDCEPDLAPDTLGEALGRTGAEVLVVRSTKVPAAVIQGADALKLIIRAGAGYDNIDTVAAGASGVAVCNCPGMNSDAVAELAMGMLIALDRRLCAQTADMLGGRWRKGEYAKADGLKGSTLCIVGLGSIGSKVALRARAFGIRVLGWAIDLTPERASEVGVEHAGVTRKELLTALGRADAVSVHLAKVPETTGFCDREFFGAMKPGAIYINTARGAVMDDAALREAVGAKGLRVGLDVYNEQPPGKAAEWVNPLADLPGAVFTHHIGASTTQAQEAVAAETVRIVRAYMDTGRFEHCVNADALAGQSV